MKIGQVPEVGRTYDTKGVGKVKKAEAVQSKRDAAAISSEGQLISKVAQAISAVPDVRQNEVDRLKPQVDSETYNVPGRDILDKLAGKIDEKA